MFLTLFSKEVRNHLLTFRFAAALLTTFLLVTISVWILADDYSRRRDTYNRTAERSAQEDLQVYVPSRISPTLHRPPSPLSIFAQGEDRRLGDSVRVRRWTVPREATGSFTDNLLMGALQDFDLLTIFTFVFSLFGLLFTYDAVSGEREEGTLKQMCTSSMRRGAIFAAKFLAGVACLALPFLLSLLCSLLILTFVFSIGFSGAHWLAVSTMVMAGLLYIAVFIAVGLLCSALTRRSSTALVFSLLFWLLGILLIPGAGQSAARMLIDLPESEEIVKLERQMRVETVSELSEFRRKNPGTGSGWTGGWGGEGYYMFDANTRNFRNTAAYVLYCEPRALARADRVWDTFKRHDELRERQAVLADSLSSIAPAHHLRRTFTLLSGTDIRAYERFLEAVRRYRRGMIDEFRNRDYFGRNVYKFFTRLDESEIDDDSYARRREEYDRTREEVGAHTFFSDYWNIFYGPLPASEIPRFSFAAGQPDFNSALAPIACLAATAIFVFLLGFVAFIRYDVR